LSLRLYRFLFWSGYLSVLVTAFIPVKGGLNKITIGPESFHIRLDFLLHFLIYFLISLYFLFGNRMGFSLFNRNPGLKFIILILILGIMTETLQLWIPERSFNFFDLLANITGFMSGLALIPTIFRRRKNYGSQ
jgi:VanZ family protein